MALLSALLEACRFCEQPQNRERVIETLALPEYVNAPIHALRMSMGDTFDFGRGRVEAKPDFNVFHGDGANRPDAAKATWVAEQMAASGLLGGTELPPDYATTIFRPDIYEQAAQYVAPARSHRRAAHPDARQGQGRQA